MAERPDPTRLRQLLRESKEISARGQALLDDPDGAKLIRDYQQVLERALDAGNVDVAAKAAAHLKNLQFREDEVRRTERAHQEAQENARRVLGEGSGQQG